MALFLPTLVFMTLNVMENTGLRLESNQVLTGVHYPLKHRQKQTFRHARINITRAGLLLFRLYSHAQLDCNPRHQGNSIVMYHKLVYLRKKEPKTHTPVYISGTEVEQVNSFRFLGINITENL